MQSNSKKTVFIVGCPRSGTTLLQQILDAHPDIAIAPETHFMRLFWGSREQYGNLAEDKNYKQLIEDIVVLPEFLEMELSTQAFAEAAWSIERNYSAVFQLLLEQFACQRQVNIVGEKTPNHVHYLPQIQEFFPEAYFIHIVRDPRSVVNSWRTVPWSTGSILEDAKIWQYYVSAIWRKPPKKRDRVFTIYYEQLILSPEKSLRSLCEFIGLRFESSMLSYHDKQSKLVNVQREPWKRNSVKPISKESMFKWKKDLSRADIVDIESVTWFEMRSHGYVAQTSAFDLLPKAGLTALQRRSHYFINLVDRNLKKVAKL